MTWNWGSIWRKGRQGIKWLITLYLLSILMTCSYGLYSLNSNNSGGGEIGEKIGPDEERYIAQIIANGVAMTNKRREELKVKEGDETYRRDAHAKAHGCLKATFEVPELDRKYSHGLFAKPGEYKSWIRYSSGKELKQSDTEKDARGMAIKVMGVEGEKLLEAEKDAKTQDFILMNAEAFFLTSLEEYVTFTRYQEEDRVLAYFHEGSLNPFRWKWQWLIRAGPLLGRPPDSLVETQFNSLTAYKHGPDNNIKYRVEPVECSSGPPFEPEGVPFWCQMPLGPSLFECDPDLLRNTMDHDIRKAAACFDFQVQVPGSNMPVEDSTVIWSEEESPFVTVAKIEIPAQEFNTKEQNNFCESLAYKPWHSLPAHRPLGAMNRVRKAVYVETSRYRRDKNSKSESPEKVQFPEGMKFPEDFKEPDGWCLDGSDKESCAPEPPSPSGASGAAEKPS